MSSTSNAARWQRAFSLLRPSHRHTAFTATLLLMASAMLSRVIGLVRVKYIAYLFGRNADADAFNAAFQLPDMISYFLVGGAASITFVTMLSRYREQGRDAEGERAMSVILTTMTLVLGLLFCSPSSQRPGMSAGGSSDSRPPKPRSAHDSRAFCYPRSSAFSPEAYSEQSSWFGSSSPYRPSLR